MPFVRTPYNYDADVDSFKSGLECEEPTLAQQQFRDECDINVMMERFQRLGEMPPPPEYGYVEFDEIIDFQTAMQRIRTAQEQFDAIPAKIREQFNNDPGQFLSFVYNENNRDKAIEMGLIAKPATPEPVVPTTPTPAPQGVAQDPT